jgi:hypothetical protein
MTLQETLDEIAEALGHRRCDKHHGWWIVGKCPDGDDMLQRFHPVPATLDAIAALWPEGRWEMSIRTWATEHGCCEWMARARRQGEPRGVETECFPTELEARAALLLAVLRHEKAAK